MTVSAATLRRIAAMGNLAAMAEVLSILADQEESDEQRKAKQRDRTRRSREKRYGNDAVTHVSQSSNTSVTSAPPDDGGITTRAYAVKKNSLSEDEQKKESNKNTAPPTAVPRRGVPVPAGFAPSMDDALGVGLLPSQFDWEAKKFMDYWSGVSGAKGCKRDWPATWRNWCRSAVERTNKTGPPRMTAGALVRALEADLSATIELEPNYDQRPPTRSISVRPTGQRSGGGHRQDAFGVPADLAGGSGRFDSDLRRGDE